MTFQCGVALSIAAVIAGGRADVVNKPFASEVQLVASAPSSLEYVPIARLSVEKRELYVVVDRANARFSVAECNGRSPLVVDGGCALLSEAWRPTTTADAGAFINAFDDAAAAHDRVAGAYWSLGGSLANFGWSELVGFGASAVLGGGTELLFLGPPLGGLIFLGYEVHDYQWRKNRIIRGDIVRFEKRRDGSVSVERLADRRSVSRDQYLAIKQALGTALATQVLP